MKTGSWEGILPGGGPRKSGHRARDGKLGAALGWRAALGAALAVVFAGCASPDDDGVAQSVAVALSPSAFVVAEAKVMETADRYVAEHPNAFVFYMQNDDMLPRYACGTALVAEPMNYRQLRVGMTAVFFTKGGIRIAHALVAQDQNTWITRGLNNASDDPDPMTGKNFLGVVVTAFAPAPAQTN
jgi:hypothetical protein